MSVKSWAKLLPIRITATLIGAWASHTTAFADSTNTNGAPLKYEEPKLLTGTIYGKDASRQQVLFKFKRVATRSGSRVNVLREYTYPDGNPAARERVVYDGNDLASDSLEELQIGAAGAVNVRRDPGNAADSVMQP